MSDADAEENPTAEELTDSEDTLQTVVRAEVLEQVLAQVQTVNQEAVFRFSDEGLEVAMVDPANVAMVRIQVDPAAFESLPSGMFAAGLDLEALEDYLDGASGSDPVSLTFDEETRRFNIRHTRVDIDMALINPDSIRDEPDIPDLELDTRVTVNSDILVDAVKTAALVSDHIRFTAERTGTGEKVGIYGEGDTDTVSVTLEESDFSDDHAVRIPNEKSTGIYSEAYLTGSNSNTLGGLLTEVPKGSNLTVRYGDEFPMKLSYQFDDGNGDALLMVAPRIDSS